MLPNHSLTIFAVTLKDHVIAEPRWEVNSRFTTAYQPEQHQSTSFHLDVNELLRRARFYTNTNTWDLHCGLSFDWRLLALSTPTPSLPFHAARRCFRVAWNRLPIPALK